MTEDQGFDEEFVIIREQQWQWWVAEAQGMHESQEEDEAGEEKQVLKRLQALLNRNTDFTLKIRGSPQKVKPGVTLWLLREGRDLPRWKFCIHW